MLLVCRTWTGKKLDSGFTAVYDSPPGTIICRYLTTNTSPPFSPIRMSPPIPPSERPGSDSEKVIRIAHASLDLPRGQILGGDVLRDFPPVASVFAFRALRALDLWRRRSEEEAREPISRAAMQSLAFRIAAAPGVPEELRQPLISIVCELASEVPEVSRMELGCVFVSDWAIGNQALRSALTFAEAAAGLAMSPRLVLVAGKMHRSLGSRRDAEAWLRVASALATRAKDWETKVRSLGALGVSQLTAGSYARAEQTLHLALRCAQRRNVRELVGEIWHHLFIVRAVAERFADADSAAKEAVLAYARDDERLPYFAHDLAVYAMDRGDHRSAVAILSALLENRHWADEPANLLLAHANMLRASGACARIAEYEASATVFDSYRERLPGAPTLAKALVSAGRGAISLDRLAEAEARLREAVLIASRRGEGHVLAQAEELLAAVHSSRTAAEPAGRPSRYHEVARITIRALGGIA